MVSRRRIVYCEFCKRGFKVPNWRRVARFCSQECYWNSGENAKNSLLKKGHTLSVGEKHWNWQGGISPYPNDFDIKREVVRQFYNYRCQGCEIHQDDLRWALDVHHIDGNKKNNVFLNLIPLCKSCHTELHWEEGKKHVRQSQ